MKPVLFFSVDTATMEPNFDYQELQRNLDEKLPDFRNVILTGVRVKATSPYRLEETLDLGSCSRTITVHFQSIDEADAIRQLLEKISSFRTDEDSTLPLPDQMIHANSNKENRQ